MGVYKFSDASSLASDKVSYKSMLAGNTTWVDWTPQGAFDSLATVTVGTTNLTSVNFVGIPSGYRHLQIRYISRSSSTGYVTGGATYMQFNGDTSNNYSFHSFRSNGSTVSVVGQSASGNNVMYVNGNTGSSASNSLTYGAAIIDIFDYSSNVKNKTIRVIGGEDNNNATTGVIDLDSGAWYSTAPITSIQILNGPFTVNSSFALYGVR